MHLRPSASVRVLSLAGLLAAGSQAHAAGFQLTEQSVTGLGRAFAGASLVADDLSAAFYNPADMMLLDAGTQVQAGVTFISVESEFHDRGSFQSLPTPSGRVSVPSRGLADDDGGTDNFVPNLYAVTDLDERIRVGLAITVPFGLRTEYADNWVGRYHALESELKTIDISPSIAYRVNEQFSIGAGVSFQYAEATLSQAIFTGTPEDGKVEITADDWGFGFNLGATYELSRDTRFGLSYRSKVKQTAEGDRELSGVGPLSGTVGAEATVELPETVYLTAYHRFDPNWSLLGTARWTKWSRFDELRIKFDNGSPDAVTVENWDDTWFFSLGVQYAYSPDLTLRAGVAYDNAAVPDAEHRTPRIPDTDRTWLALGASYKPSQNLSLDVGYAHLFGEDVDMRNTLPIARTAGGAVLDTLIGEFEGSTDILGAQLTYRF